MLLVDSLTLLFIFLQKIIFPFNFFLIFFNIDVYRKSENSFREGEGRHGIRMCMPIENLKASKREIMKAFNL